MLTMQQLDEFKKDLEKELKIVKWAPTYIQIADMYRQIIAVINSNGTPNIIKIVNDVYGKPITVFVTDGLDMSTESILLAKLRAQAQERQQGDKK
ncbi:S-(hydroxymethyl)glutathione dehydrogenase [Enterobacter hormaechei subsp. steigerwaltii]|uniref:S-(hydroxymethyl)glutathione dehydrogenase n=1 Tax=Enterobacter hormaechei TaxID=158836 RepID=UPI002FD24139